MDPLQDAFYKLVATLSGVAIAKVIRADQKANYFGLFNQLAGAEGGQSNAAALLALFVTLAEKGMAPQAIVSGILAGDYDPHAPAQGVVFSELTRALTLFVLTGLWDPNCNPENASIPTPEAYAEGLVWLIAQAHPAGYSNMLTRSWTNVPPPLSQFIGA